MKPLYGVNRIVPFVAKYEAEIARKPRNFGDLILPPGCDSFGLIDVAFDREYCTKIRQK